MGLEAGTAYYLESLAMLAVRRFETVSAAVDAIFHMMGEQLGMRSSFLAHIERGSSQLEVVAAHNLPGGCDIQVGTAVPLVPYFPALQTRSEMPSSLELQQLTDLSSNHVLGSLSHVGSYIAVPVILANGIFLACLEPRTRGPRCSNPSSLKCWLCWHGCWPARLSASGHKSSLLQRYEELRETKTHVSEVISIAGHEFRAALAGILGFSELIRDEDFSVAEIKVYAADINADARRLSTMIAEMLDLQ